MKIIDTHAHFNDNRFQDDLYEVLDKCKTNNVTRIVNISADINDCNNLKSFTDNLNEHYKDIKFYYTLGIHPDEIDLIDVNDNNYQNIDLLDNNKKYQQLENIVKENKNSDTLVAIGEIGLDYYGENKQDLNIKLSQQNWFINQLKLAKEYNLPVVIHSRDALDDTYNILRNNLCNNKAVLHCYSYNKENLQKFLDLGLYIGIGGVLTFKNGIKLKEVAEICPLDRIVLETDSPYLAPTPHRGERNDSSYINYVITELSNIKKIDKEELSNICYNNSLKLFNLED